MSGVVSALTNTTTGLTPSVLYAQVEELVPLLVIIIPFALGVHFLRKLIKGSGKAKVRF